MYWLTSLGSRSMAGFIAQMMVVGLFLFLSLFLVSFPHCIGLIAFTRYNAASSSSYNPKAKRVFLASANGKAIRRTCSDPAEVCVAFCEPRAHCREGHGLLALLGGWGTVIESPHLGCEHQCSAHSEHIFTINM